MHLARLKLHAVAVRSNRNKVVHFHIEPLLIALEDDSAVGDIQDSAQSLIGDVIHLIGPPAAEADARSFEKPGCRVAGIAPNIPLADSLLFIDCLVDVMTLFAGL